MGRIIGYQYDDNVQDGDAWIGSEDGGGRTKQYTAEAVANYLNIQGKISIVGQMTYKYGVTPLSGPGTFAVFGGGTDPVAFSAITKLTLSNTDVSKQRVVEFLNLLVGSDILISKQSAISTFGYYSIDNYAVNATDPAYYDLGVTFKSGNGSMEAEQIYETQNFTLAAEENISTLQTTIDSGNTYQATPSAALWTWGASAITVASTSFTSLLSSKRFKTTLIADGSYTDVLPNQLIFNNALGNETSITPNTVLSSNIDLQLPSSSGTLALTTDITASPWDTVTGGINYANGNVGIGTTTPSAKLDVNGDALINGLTVGQGAGTSDFGNTVFGKTALESITTGRRNVAIGNEALLDNTVGNHNIALGYRSLENNSASNNVAIGVEALQRVETAGNNTAVGRYTLGLTSGAGNTAIGYAAGYLRVGGTNGGSINSVFIGSLTTSNGINPENEIVIGTGAVSAGSNTVVLGNDDIVSTRLKGDVIVANGNVGIGTTSPSEKLEVSGGNIKGDGIIQIESTTNNNIIGKLVVDYWSSGRPVLGSVGGSGIAIKEDLSLRFNSGLYGGTTSSNGLTIGTNRVDTPIIFKTSPVTSYVHAERMRITGAGNVGIGTTSPSHKLTVNAANNTTAVGIDFPSAHFNFSANSTSGYTSNFRLDDVGMDIGHDSTARSLNLQTGNLDRVTILGNGNVGIGTTSPSTSLDVVRSGNSYIQTRRTNASATTLKLGSETGVNVIVSRDGGTGNAPLAFLTGVSERMRIDSSGNVGIGTTSPSQKLEVNGNVLINGAAPYISIKTTQTGTPDWKIYNSYNTVGDFAIVGGSSVNNKFNIQPNGNVGIGTTSPAYKLDVTGSARIDGVLRVGTTAQNGEIKIIDSNGKTFSLNSGNVGNNKFAIEESGTSVRYLVIDGTTSNVGIGVTAPSQKLEVDGQVLSDGYRLAAMQTAPATRNSTGTLGEIVIDGNHIYVCYATDSWSRVALDTSW